MRNQFVFAAGQPGQGRALALHQPSLTRDALLIAGRPKRSHGLYCPLITLAHHHVMRNREDMNAVIEGLQRDHALLAAFEATDKIDWRALHRRVAIGETSNKPVNLETLQASIPLRVCRP